MYPEDSPEEGFHLYRNIRRMGISTDPVSSSLAIKCCAKIRSLIEGVQVHGRVLVDGHQRDSLLLATLMNFYSVCERIDDCLKVFGEIPHRDVVCWNVMISCYLLNKRSIHALDLFDLMFNSGPNCKPDQVTCLHVLQACTNLNALEFGEKVHKYIEENGFDGTTNLCNSLISMYSRCGDLEKAYGVFKRMGGKKNVVTWSAWVSGLAVNGYGRDAIEAFFEMIQSGVIPDDKTFTGVLSACGHSGLVNEGMMLFEKMSRDFNMLPNVHHYGCMINLLGRAGMLNQAYDMILSMRVRPDATLWRTLLGACRIHRHITLGERVVEHLIELKAQEAGDYVLLLNMYSSAGNWEKVAEVRQFMKERGIQTTPGCSTIEFGGVVHEFNVDDISHPRYHEVYAALDEIGQQLRIAGYVPEISSELHNLSVEEKGSQLSYHSEKLAIAFGVLMTPPGKTIRIANNIRICTDCHSFAKVLSSAYNREVVIRDRSRFHHFRRGVCTCNDYW
ncbi:hypothetical protein SAY86_003717 [Trapa natans]|uniref:DYW domain-containing protein n=1 Tax=Trapa natans TaxID=22666 RepID=A0AAN7RI67_TRANT|nr:hypothetical protein SAY86_003717 [Trapa natans]